LTGIVVRTKGLDRLIISVSLLMRSVSVEIDRMEVKPLGRPEIVEAAVRVSGEMARAGRVPLGRILT
jgi:hypothetical protein